MERSDFSEQRSIPAAVGGSPASTRLRAGAVLDSRSQGPGSDRESREGGPPHVFVFNPLAEGYIAHGKTFTPVKHQAMLAEDLANLPQFLCQSGDLVLLPKRPSARFLDTLAQAGFPTPEFMEVPDGCVDAADSCFQREYGGFRPWAWGPDSVQLLEPLSPRLSGRGGTATQWFHPTIVPLYSKTWSAGFLRKVLARVDGSEARILQRAGRTCALGEAAWRSWICSEAEVGQVVATLGDALEVIASLRGRGDQRLVVKEAIGLAGHNAIRLWESEILPAQRRWLARALERGRELVIEPWLERALDFSVQLEMGTQSLALCGWTGLVNDRKGQFLANWGEPEFRQCVPQGAHALFSNSEEMAERMQRLYDEIFSMLEEELRTIGFIGPVSIDALVYRTVQGDCRLKPIVEINPRYTMGRLTLELMEHVCPGSCGLFRVVNRAQARREGFANLACYGRALRERHPLALDGGSPPRIRQGALCLNDPEQAQVCLATFEVGRSLKLPGSSGGHEERRNV